MKTTMSIGKRAKKLVTGVTAVVLAALALPTTELNANAISVFCSKEDGKFKYTVIKDGEGIEFLDEESTAYFTDPKGELWQFEKIYILPEDYVPVRQDMHYNSSYGIRIEKYKGDPEDIHFISEYKEMSKRITGNFTFEGEECEYNLVSPEYLSYGLIALTLKMVVKTEPTTKGNISSFDCNMDGKIDIRDVIIMSKNYYSCPIANVRKSGYDIMRTEADTFWKLFEQRKSYDTSFFIRFGDEPEQAEEQMIEVNEENQEFVIEAENEAELESDSINFESDEITLLEAVKNLKGMKINLKFSY